jgi:hypothetical protein
MYHDAYQPPITTVLLECDATDTLESATHRIRVPRGLVIHEIFETENDIVIATHAAIERQQANMEQEAHQAMLYFWSASEWQRLAPGGTLMMDKPAPMSAAEIAEVFEQLAQHPNYKNYKLFAISQDLELIQLIDGKVNIAKGTPPTRTGRSHDPH